MSLASTRTLGAGTHGAGTRGVRSERPLTVVIVDDSDFDMRLHSRVIRKARTAVSLGTFSYADTALQDLLQQGPGSVDLILLDINMPRMNGFEFLAEARMLFGGDLPSVAMLTTSADPHDLHGAAADPAVIAYLRKPMRPEDFDMLAARLGEPRPDLAANLLRGAAAEPTAGAPPQE